MKLALDTAAGTKLTGTVDSILESKGRQVYSIGPKQSVYEAVRKMAEHEIGALFVLDDSRLVGVISERDYARKIILQARSSADTLVEEIMTSPVIYVEGATPLAECMRIVTQARVRHLPVLEAGTVVGVVSIGDLMNMVVSQQAQTIEQLSTMLTSPYPA